MGVFLWMSDLHIDPYYGTGSAVNHKNGNNCSLPDNATLLEFPLGRVGCDAPLSLLRSALRGIHTTKNNTGDNKNNKNNKNANNNNSNENNAIDFVLVTGDFGRHSIDDLGSPTTDPIDVAGSILSTCIETIHTFLPGVPVMPVLGNNDVVPDYYLETRSCCHDDTSEDANTTAYTTAYTTANTTANTTATIPTNFVGNEETNKVLTMATNGLREAFLSEEEARMFAHGGYFSRLVEISGTGDSPSSILILSLNTVLYSSFHKPDYGSGDETDETDETNEFDDETDENGIDDPLGQFAWMKDQLAMAAARSGIGTNKQQQDRQQPLQPPRDKPIVAVYLAGHVPPSVGSYRHTQLWKNRYLEKYASILRDYSEGKYYHRSNTKNNSDTNTTDSSPSQRPPPPILGNFFGHVHTEEFRLLDFGKTDKNGDGDGDDSSSNKQESLVFPLLVTSSITPIYGSNPSYKMVRYDDDTGALLDYTTRYLDLGSNANNTERDWIELPGFAETYGVPDLSRKSFKIFRDNLEGELLQSRCPGLSSGDRINNTSNISLWDTFLHRQDLYSTAPDNGDIARESNIASVMTDWLCTIKAITSDDYVECLGESSTRDICGGGLSSTATTSNNNGWSVLLLIATNLLAAVGVLAAFRIISKKKRARRKMYRSPGELPLAAGDNECGDGVFVANGSRGKRSTPPTEAEIGISSSGELA